MSSFNEPRTAENLEYSATTSQGTNNTQQSARTNNQLLVPNQGPAPLTRATYSEYMRAYCGAQMNNFELRKEMQSYDEDVRKFLEQMPVAELSTITKKFEEGNLDNDGYFVDQHFISIQDAPTGMDPDSNTDLGNGIGMNRQNHFGGGYHAEAGFPPMGNSQERIEDHESYIISAHDDDETAADPRGSTSTPHDNVSRLGSPELQSPPATPAPVNKASTPASVVPVNSSATAQRAVAPPARFHGNKGRDYSIPVVPERNKRNTFGNGWFRAWPKANFANEVFPVPFGYREKSARFELLSATEKEAYIAVVRTKLIANGTIVVPAAAAGVSSVASSTQSSAVFGGGLRYGAAAGPSSQGGMSGSSSRQIHPVNDEDDDEV